ncbi:hypothetical protein PG997_005209 [Apiospora hydei]|uniref:Uncharacterized protein n=1 Tax=Apiospora hydei TaxID=1337664 RepID=A0ABR1X4A1_9PEZI
MLVPLLLALPLGILGLAMPPRETASPGLQPRDAPPVVQVMTMTCLLPGEEETSSSSSSSSTTSSSSDGWSWSPDSSSSMSSSSTSGVDDCWYWGNCSSSSAPYPASSASSSSVPDWCELFGWDCPGSSSSWYWPMPTASSSSVAACDEYDPYCSYTASATGNPWSSAAAPPPSPSPSPTPSACDPWAGEHCSFFTIQTPPVISVPSSTSDWFAASKTSRPFVPSPGRETTIRGTGSASFTTLVSSRDSSSAVPASGSDSSSSFSVTFHHSSHHQESTRTTKGVTTSVPHHILPPMIGDLSQKQKRAAPPPPPAPAPRNANGLYKRPSSDRIRNVRAVEKRWTETIVIGVSTDGTPVYTSTEYPAADESSSSSTSTSFFSASGGGAVVTPAPQWISVSPSSSIRCDDTFCSDGSSWCMYWAGLRRGMRLRGRCRGGADDYWDLLRGVIEVERKGGMGEGVM